MDTYPRLVALAALAACSPAFAFYQTVTPPAGYDNVLKTYTRQPGEQAFMNGIRGTAKATANVAGKAVPMAVAYKFGPTAARVAMLAAFGSPQLFLAAAAGVAIHDWYKNKGVDVDSTGFSEMVEGKIITVRYNVGGTPIVYKSTQEAACRAYFQSAVDSVQAGDPAHTYSYDTFVIFEVASAGIPGLCKARRLTWYPEFSGYMVGNMSVPVYYSVGEVTTSTKVKLATPEALAAKMGSAALPPDVIEAWPMPVPWPIEKPILNPTPETLDPTPQPLPQPLRVPSGDPVKQGTTPETYKSPVTDIVPSPTVDDPWRVDQQTKDITSLSPAPLDIAPVPVTPPAGETSQQSFDTPGLCDLYPDILACAKPELGSIDPLNVPDQTVNVSISPMAGFGADNASCPAPKSFTVQGRSFNMPFTLICDYASGLRPLIIAFAWLGAALMLIAAGRRNG